MPKELLLELVKNKEYLYILMIFLVYIINWTAIFKLGLVLNQCKVSTKKIILPGALIGAVYSLMAKQIIPDYLYFFTSILMIFFILKKLSKQQAARVFFTAVISLLTGIFSFLLLGQPLLIYSNFRTFMFGPHGVIIGSLTESFLPIFFVLIYRNTKHSKENHTCFVNITLNIVLLFIVYCFFAIIFYLLATNYNSILWQVLISEIILICITFFVFFRMRSVIKQQQQQSEENHSTYLLRTILSKQREYRNFFQVIRAMAEKERNQNIVDYIDNIFADMSLAGDCDGVNPIFAACQVAEQIKAKEKGVKISTKTKSPLNNLKEPIKVYDIFRDLLQFFIAYEERFLEDEHQINVEIDETDQDYIFKITRKNGREKLKGEFITISSPPEGECTLEQIAKRIRKLRGKVYFLYKEDELRGCLFRVAKAKPLNFLSPV